VAQDQPVDVLELLVAIRMHAALPRLAVRLQAEPQPAEQPRHGPLARPEATRRELTRQPPLAAADPAQRRFRVAADGAVDERLECLEEARLAPLGGSASAARPTDAARDVCDADRDVGEAAPDRAAGDAGSLRHRGNAAGARRLRLGRGEHAPSALVEKWRRSEIPAPDRFDVNHPSELARFV